MFNVFSCATMGHIPISGPVIFCSHFASLSGPWCALLWPSGSGSKNTGINSRAQISAPARYKPSSFFYAIQKRSQYIVEIADYR
jgi:hypothetical protein